MPGTVYANSTYIRNSVNIIRDNVSELKTIINQMNYIIENTKIYWNGEASEKHYGLLTYLEEGYYSLDSVFQKGEDIITALETIATNYESTEAEVLEKISKLENSFY